jgi:hypothetical protein
MAITVDSILQFSATLLNDANQNTYTNAVLLPLLQIAYQELQAECDNNNISIIKDILASTDVAALDTEVDPPDDLILPIELYERADGSTSESDWQKMTQKEWEPNTPMASSLIYWTWREGKFKFVGATTPREIKIRYLRDFDAINEGSNINQVANSRLFLQYETASLCAYFIMKMEKLGDRLERKADRFLQATLGTEVKANQGFVVTRRPFGASRRARGRNII